MKAGVGVAAAVLGTFLFCEIVFHRATAFWSGAGWQTLLVEALVSLSVGAWYGAAEIRKLRELAGRQEDEWALKMQAEAVGEVFFVTNIETGRVQWTGDTMGLFGCKPEEMDPTLDKWIARSHPERMDEVKALLARLEREFTGDSLRFTSFGCVRGRDNRYIWLLMRAQRVRTAEGVLDYGGMIDVTILYERIQRLQEIADASGTYIFEADAEERYTYISPKVRDVLGYEPEQMLGRPWTEFLVPEDVEKVLADTVGRTRADYQLRHFIHRKRRADGGTIWAESTMLPVLGVDGRRLGFRGSTRDITARRTAELELQHSREMLEHALKASRSIAGESDLLTGDLTLPPEWGEMFHFPPAKIPTRCTEILDLLHPDDLTRFQEVINADGDDRQIEVRHLTGRGDYIWVQISRRNVCDSAGRKVRMVYTMTDISDRKEMEFNLIAAKEAAEKANRVKEQFLGVMSHELRTPLNSVIGFADLMALGELSEEQRDYLGIIRSSGDALLGMLGDILEYARMGSEKFQLDVAPFDLRKMFDEIPVLFDSATAGKGISLSLQVDESVPERVRGDAGRMRQILLNIVGNAVKFTAEGGITIRVACRDTAAVNGRCRLRIEVQDTGIGIPPERIDDLFQPFTQVDASRSRSYGGTGLGLAISRRLARLMDGDIGIVESTAHGSTFFFEAEMDSAETGEACCESCAEMPRFASLRVLVAEDNRVNRLLLVRMLHQYGIDPDEAANGRECLEKCANSPYDVILMDVQMPEMDGVEATRRIRETEAEGRAPRVHIVAITANAMAGDREYFLAAGMDGYLSKPFKREALEEALRQNGIPSSTSDGLDLQEQMDRPPEPIA
jgi:PAS domain S-box-containing protein